MKKNTIFSRLLALTLALMLCVSLVSVVAFADEGTEEAQPTQTDALDEAGGVF